MPVLNRAYPIPDRSAQTVNLVRSADGTRDLGWCEGVLSDGRAFRAEFWTQDGISLLTFFFSRIGLETASGDALFELVNAEGLVRAKPGGRPSFEVVTWTDPHGAVFWSVNVTVGTEDETYLADSVAVVRFSADGPNTNFR